MTREKWHGSIGTGKNDTNAKEKNVDKISYKTMEFSHLEFYLQTGKYHPNTPDFKKRGIRKASHNFVVKGSNLVYIGKGRTQLVCRSDDEKKAAVQWAHDKRPGNELCNPKETLKMIQKSFYWHGITKDFEKKLFPCELCQQKLQGNGLLILPYGSKRKRSLQECDVFEVGDPGNSPFHDLDNGNESTQSEEAKKLKKWVDQRTMVTVSSGSVTERLSNTDLHSTEIMESLPHKLEANENLGELFHLPSPNELNHSSDTEDWLHRFQSRDLSTMSTQSDPESLVERISELEAVNSMLIRENDLLKKKLATLHRTLENQESLPALEDLIKQLRQSIPQTITTTISNFRG